MLSLNIHPDKLWRAVLVPACRDAVTGDEATQAEARAWLLETGALLAEQLHVARAELVRAWAAHPTQPPGWSVMAVAARAGVSRDQVIQAIYRGELTAYRDIFRHGAGYTIPEAEARTWARRQNPPHVSSQGAIHV